MQIYLSAFLFLGRILDLYDDALAERCKGGLDLIEPRGMAQIEQPVHLWQVAIEPPREFGFADTLFLHCDIEQDLSACECR
jgi:hypothetical protein